MAALGAPRGNQNAIKGKEFMDRLRKICVQDDYKQLEKAAQSLLDQAACGEPWAIQMLADRFDGKPNQSTDVNLNNNLVDVLANLGKPNNS